MENSGKVISWENREGKKPSVKRHKELPRYYSVPFLKTVVDISLYE